MSLRDRCKAMNKKLTRDAILRQGDPVEALAAFVQSERGRSADRALEDAKSLILYFRNEEDRAEFMALVREIKPGMMAKEIP